MRGSEGGKGRVAAFIGVCASVCLLCWAGECRSFAGQDGGAGSGKRPGAEGRKALTEVAPGTKQRKALTEVAPGTKERKALTEVAQVRGLSEEEAKSGLRVKLKGVVTAFSGYKNSFFLQDRKTGISVDRTDEAEVRLGDVVEVTGTSGPGLFAPVVLASHVRVVGRRRRLDAHRVTLGDLFGGAQDSQWIQVRGTVRSAQMSELFGHRLLTLDVEIGGGQVKLFVQEYDGLDWRRLVDATVVARGVCSSSSSEKRQAVALSLFVPERRDLRIEQVAAEDPFQMETIAVRKVLRFGQGQHRVKVAGVVTHQIAGHALYLQDGSDGIRVESSAQDKMALGTRVEAVGFAALGEYSPVLEDAVVRVRGTGAPVQPVRMEAKDVVTMRDGFLRVKYDQQLVTIHGELVQDLRQGGEKVWILRDQGVLFDAHVPTGTPEQESMGLVEPGTVVSLTGICTVHADSGHNPQSFSVLVRTPEDVRVLKRAPWLTPQRCFALLLPLVGAVMLVLVWVAALRRRVEQQTRTIRESEGQFRYLAEHDALTGLSNRRAILGALEREMARRVRERSAVVVVLADIDHFKRVNDVHGHLAGDEALRRFAKALGGCIRPYDSVGRYGGEEFLMVLTGISAGEVEERLEGLHRCISGLRVRVGATEFWVTCSLGAVFLGSGQAEVDPHGALAAADEALYEAKETGRDRVVLRMAHAKKARERALAG